MNPRVTAVTPLKDYKLLLGFTNGEQRIFDMSPYLDKGVFKQLKDIAYFNAVRVSGGSIVWPEEQDLCPDTLYEKSIPVDERKAA
jgi:hypothetical protein